MKVIQGKVQRSIEVTEDTRLLGMIVGSATVTSSTTLELDGTVTGNLILKEYSRVNLHGTVNGDVVNEGGYLAVFGVVNGRVVRLGGETSIDSKGVVQKGLV